MWHQFPNRRWPAWGHLAPLSIVAALALSACAPAAAPTPTAAPKAAPTAPTTAAQTKPAGTETSKPAPTQAPAAKPVAKVSLKSAFTTTSATMAPLWAAKEGGFFESEGLDVSLSRIQAGAPILAALRSGDVPIAFGGAQQVVEANLQGADYAIVAGFVDTLGQQVYAHPSIERPEQLRGKAMGVTNFGAITHVASRIALRHWGIDEKDVTFLAIGGPPETLAALQGGRIQAAAFSPPEAFKARDEGLRLLLDLSKINVRSASAVAITTVKWAKENSDLVERYLRAVVKGSHRLKTDKEFGTNVIMKYSGIEDRRVAAETYDYYVEQWSRDGIPSMEGIKLNIDLAAEQNAAAMNARPEQFLDSTFVQKIKSSGLVEQLWGKN